MASNYNPSTYGNVSSSTPGTDLNAMHLEAIMVGMFRDKKLARELPFKDQTALTDYIDNNYAEKYSGISPVRNAFRNIVPADSKLDTTA